MSQGWPKVGRKASALIKQCSATDPEQESPSKSGDSNLDKPKGLMARKVHSNKAGLRIKPVSQVSGSRAGRRTRTSTIHRQAQAYLLHSTGKDSA